jgi:hypothetical protein
LQPEPGRPHFIVRGLPEFGGFLRAIPDLVHTPGEHPFLSQTYAHFAMRAIQVWADEVIE